MLKMLYFLLFTFSFNLFANITLESLDINGNPPLKNVFTYFHNYGFSESGDEILFATNRNDILGEEYQSNRSYYIRNIVSGNIERINVTNSSQLNRHSTIQSVSISRDFRFLTYYSRDADIINSDGDTSWNVYIFDRQTGQNKNISKGAEQGHSPRFSKNGRFLVYRRLIAGDHSDIVVYDTETFEKRVISFAGSSFCTPNKSTLTFLCTNKHDQYLSKIFVSDTGERVIAQVPDGKYQRDDKIILNDKGSDVWQVLSHNGYIKDMSGNGETILASYNVGNNDDPDGKGVIITFETGDLPASFLTSFDYSINEVDLPFGLLNRVIPRKLALNNRHIVLSSMFGIYHQLYLYDLVSKEVQLMAASYDGSNGGVANSYSGQPFISNNGCKVSFMSAASNLVSADRDQYADIFIKNFCVNE